MNPATVLNQSSEVDNTISNGINTVSAENAVAGHSYTEATEDRSPKRLKLDEQSASNDRTEENGRQRPKGVAVIKPECVLLSL